MKKLIRKWLRYLIRPIVSSLYDDRNQNIYECLRSVDRRIAHLENSRPEDINRAVFTVQERIIKVLAECQVETFGKTSQTTGETDRTAAPHSPQV